MVFEHLSNTKIPTVNLSIVVAKGMLLEIMTEVIKTNETMNNNNPTTANQPGASRIISAAYPMLGKHSTSSSSFRAVFGVCSDVAAIVFQAIVSDARNQKGFKTFSEKHLLWGLYLLKCYPTDRVGSLFAGSSIKTFAKWSKHAVNHIAALFSKKVRSNLFDDLNSRRNYLVSPFSNRSSGKIASSSTEGVQIEPSLLMGPILRFLNRMMSQVAGGLSSFDVQPFDMRLASAFLVAI